MVERLHGRVVVWLCGRVVVWLYGCVVVYGCVVGGGVMWCCIWWCGIVGGSVMLYDGVVLLVCWCITVPLCGRAVVLSWCGAVVLWCWWCGQF